MNLDLPTTEMPEALLRATEALEEREAAVRAAEAAVVAAGEAVKAAHERDVAEIAASRERGAKRVPQPEHEQEALAVLAAAEREAEIAGARRDQVAREHEIVAAQERPRWREAVERAWRKIDAAQRRRIAELAAAAERAQELQIAWRYVDTIDNDPSAAERTLRKAMAPAAAVQIDLSGVLAAVEATSCDVVTARVLDERRDWQEHGAATHAASEALEEQAHAERQREIQRAVARRDALG